MAETHNIAEYQIDQRESLCRHYESDTGAWVKNSLQTLLDGLKLSFKILVMFELPLSIDNISATLRRHLHSDAQSLAHTAFPHSLVCSVTFTSFK